MNQLLGTYQAQVAKMVSYIAHVKTQQSTFDEFKITQVPMLKNNHAAALANLGSSVLATESQHIPLVYLQWPTMWKDPPSEFGTIDTSDTWMTPIIQYLDNDELPSDKNEARCLWAKAARFTILDGKLLRRSFSKPYLRCVTPIEANYILVELYQGECGNHAGGHSLTNLALTTGYYWLTMHLDTKNIVHRCKSCQRFAEVSHLPPERFNTFLSPWPFMKWGTDIQGKLGPTREGPYKISKIVGQGAHKLQAQDGHDIHNSLNATHLKLYHF